MAGRLEQLAFGREVLLRAIDAGIIEPRVSTRALARASGVSHETARRWFNGGHVCAETDRRLRAVLGLDEPRP